jgi:hypothetical protein
MKSHKKGGNDETCADNTFTIKNKNKKERSNFSTCFWSE